MSFFLEMLKSKSDRAFVMGFDVTPTVTQDWTNNIDGLETGVNRLRPGGGTALYDAVYTACRDKLLDVSRGQEPIRKAIILLSDGDDNQSRVYLDEAIKECQRAETIIYAISTNWTPSRGKGDKVLAQMAEDTGGQVFFPPSVEEVANSFKDIEEELAQPVCFDLYTGRLQDGWLLPNYLSVLQRPALPGSSAQGLLCAAGINKDRSGPARRCRESLCRRAFSLREVDRSAPGVAWPSLFLPLFFQYETGIVPFQDNLTLTVHNRFIHKFFSFRSHRILFLPMKRKMAPHECLDEAAAGP